MGVECKSSSVSQEDCQAPCIKAGGLLSQKFGTVRASQAAKEKLIGADCVDPL